MTAYLEDYGPIALFMATFLEATGLPLPGETALIASSVLAASGKINFVSVFASAFLGAVLGDNLGYAIGHYAGRALVVRYGSWLGIQDGHLARVEAYVARYGSLLVIAARFFPVVRQLGGLAAGTAGMAWPRFIVANATGAALWVGWWIGLGVWLGRDAAKLLTLHRGSFAHVVIAILSVVLFLTVVGLVLRWLLGFGRG